MVKDEDYDRLQRLTSVLAFQVAEIVTYLKGHSQLAHMVIRYHFSIIKKAVFTTLLQTI